MIGVFRPRPTAFVRDWFTASGGRRVADSKAENKTHTGTPVDELGGYCDPTEEVALPGRVTRSRGRRGARRRLVFRDRRRARASSGVTGPRKANG